MIPHSGPDPESPLMRRKEKQRVSEDAFKTEFDGSDFKDEGIIMV